MYIYVCRRGWPTLSIVSHGSGCKSRIDQCSHTITLKLASHFFIQFCLPEGSDYNADKLTGIFSKYTKHLVSTFYLLKHIRISVLYLDLIRVKQHIALHFLASFEQFLLTNMVIRQSIRSDRFDLLPYISSATDLTTKHIV